jgi:hypothetical protein
MSNLRILGRDELREGSKVKQEPLPLPELGENVGVVVRGFTMGEVLEIQAAAMPEDENGKRRYDARQDKLLSLITCLVEPQLTIEDTAWLTDVKDGIVDKILDLALRLTGRSKTAYESLKDEMRLNPYLRRIYSVCANVLGRLPSELAEVSEEEFNRLLAVLEMEAEEIKEEVDRARAETPE